MPAHTRCPPPKGEARKANAARTLTPAETRQREARATREATRKAGRGEAEQAVQHAEETRKAPPATVIQELLRSSGHARRPARTPTPVRYAPLPDAESSQSAAREAPDATDDPASGTLSTDALERIRERARARGVSREAQKLLDEIQPGTDGLGAMPRKWGKDTKKQIRNPSVLRAERARLVPKTQRHIPEIDDIQPWQHDIDPCTGLTYDAFRSPFTRKDLYYHLGERRVSQKQATRLQYQAKRESWQVRLHECAMRVFKNRARVSKDPKMKVLLRRLEAMEGRREPGDDDEPITRYDDTDTFDLFGLGGAKTRKRKAKKPKKRKRSR